MLLTPKLCGADEVKSDLRGHPLPTFWACQIYGKGVKSKITISMF